MMIDLLTTTAAPIADAVVHSVQALPAVFPTDGLIPNPSPSAPPGTGKVSDLLGWLKWGGLIASVIGIFGLAIAMALARKEGHGDNENFLKVFLRIMIAVILLGAAASLVGWIGGV